MPNRTKPNYLKAVKGSYRPGKDGELDSPRACNYPELPKCFLSDKDLTGVWNSVRELLEPLGYIDTTDAHILEVYCRLVLEQRNNPDFSGAKLTQMRLIAGDLGLTPGSRHRMPKSPDVTPSDNPFSFFTNED